MVYAATVDTQTYTFQASGSLWQDALVMQDLETESLWSQVSGECIKGKLKGKHLKLVPSIHLSFGEFKSRYPDGVVLEKPSSSISGSPYDEYYADQSKLGIFGRVDNYNRLPGKSLIYGVRIGGKQAAVSGNYLEDNSYATVVTTKPPALLTQVTPGNAVAAFSLEGFNHEQIESIKMIDSMIVLPGSDQRWDLGTGKSLTEGADLDPVPVVTSYWFAWVSFFPESDLVK